VFHLFIAERRCGGTPEMKPESITDVIGVALSRLVRWFFAPRELIRIQQIELRKLHEYNGSLAKENHELWTELTRLESPLAAAREARMAAELEAAMQEGRVSNQAR
jgi:hypothetical protein